MTTTARLNPCTATTKSGQPCKAMARPGKTVCFAHDPQLAAKRAAARRKGGQARHKRTLKQDDPVIAINTLADIQDLLEWGITDLLKLERSVKRMNTFAALLKVAVSLHEQTEMMQRIEALEERLDAPQDVIRSHDNGHYGEK